MAKMTYSEQLKHPNWQRKRLEAMDSAGFECQNCGENTIMLNVHHKRYIKGRMAWEYDLSDLAVLCEPCHSQEHEERQLLEWILAQAGPGAIGEAVSLLAGYFHGMEMIEPGVAEMARQTYPPGFYVGVGACALALSGENTLHELVREAAKKHPHMKMLVAVACEWEPS